ncbi:MAG: hypothetical protein KDC44_02200, partial [Phaeodactylibacter sp.]|nr:hypothetical protein [Phaeodactylibacter sp.]
MKSIYRSIIIVWMLLLSWSTTLSAQISINTDDSAPDASAMLDVKSTDKGILLPRMSSAERNNITAPTAGLILFDTDTESFWFYNGISWTDLNTSIATTTFIDADQDTKIELEEGADDAINFDMDGTHYLKMINGKIANSNQRYNVYLGGAAGYTDDLIGDNRNVGIGDSSMFLTTTGRFNTAIGYRSMYSNTTGRENASNGYQALSNNTIGQGNVAIGYNAMLSNITSDNNVAIGWEADVQEGLTNAVAIGKSTTAVQSNSFILGDGNSNVGIGTSNPQERLHVVGQVQIQDGTEADGYALTTDADGLASWQPYDGDNFGNHTAIQNIDFNSKNVTKAGSLEFDTNDDQLKILLNSK